MADAHFRVEHPARMHAGLFFNFNGTAGIWRRACIEDAGGWSDDTVTWSAAGSNDDLDLDGLGGIVSYQWDFGDGQTATTLVPSATHFYAAPGSYAATVTVTDNNGEGTVATASASVPYEVTAAAGANGAIAPAGAITIAPGASQTYAITPDPCYHVADVVVDGVSVGPASSYSFDQVSADHMISVSFALTKFFSIPF